MITTTAITMVNLLAAFISSMVIGMLVVPAIVVAAKDDHVRLGWSDINPFTAVALGTHVPDTAGKNNESKHAQHDCAQNQTKPPCAHNRNLIHKRLFANVKKSPGNRVL